MYRLVKEMFSIYRLKFPFPVGSRTLETPYHNRTPCLLTPSQISHLPSPHTPSLLYHVAMSGGSVEKFLATHSLREANGNGEVDRNDVPPVFVGDLMSLKFLWPPSSLGQCLRGLREARSHSRVVFWLDHMMLAGQCCRFEITSSKEKMAASSSSLCGEGEERSGECEGIITKVWEDAIGRYIQK